MTEVDFREHSSPDELAEAVAEQVGRAVDSSIGRERLFAFPGGSSPAPIFAALTSRQHRWEGVTVIPGDDRLVTQGSPLSNFAAIANAFAASDVRVIPLAEPNDDYRAVGEAADSLLHRLPWPPELVWLGMGRDGHTASIFPGPDYDAALSSECRAVGVLPDPLPPEAPVARVTLTASSIRSARATVITIAGEAKREVIETALAEGNDSQFPIGRVLAGANLPISIHWCP